MSRAQRRAAKMPKQAIPVLDMTREHLALADFTYQLQGVRWNGQMVERCENGEETPFKIHILDSVH